MITVLIALGLFVAAAVGCLAVVARDIFRNGL